MKEEKITDNGDSSMQDNVKSLIPNLGVSRVFSNYTINISLSHVFEVTLYIDLYACESYLGV